MDSNGLRLFRAVAQSGSVAAAADSVHSVPSNISARIRKLEDELGAQLFVREPRGMRLTAAGEVLADYAERILALGAEAKAAVAEVVGGEGPCAWPPWKAPPPCGCRPSWPDLPPAIPASACR